MFAGQTQLGFERYVRFGYWYFEVGELRSLEVLEKSFSRGEEEISSNAEVYLYFLFESKSIRVFQVRVTVVKWLPSVFALVDWIASKKNTTAHTDEIVDRFSASLFEIFVVEVKIGSWAYLWLQIFVILAASYVLFLGFDRWRTRWWKCQSATNRFLCARECYI